MRYYTLDALERLYRQEHPDLPDREIKERAKQLHRQLNTWDIRWRRSNRRFYKMNQLKLDELL